MSKSLKRVRAALRDAGLAAEPVEMADTTRTAEDAAAAVGCVLDQIVKSIVFRGDSSGQVVLFLTAGGNRVDPARASAVAGEPLGRADADFVRATTGFAIGGVSPVGHLSPPRIYIDPRLFDFGQIWAAAGTPRHVFPTDPTDLERATGATRAEFTS